MSLGLALCPPALRAQSVSMVWNPDTNPNVVGYKVYFGTDGTNFNNQVDAGSNTFLTISNLPTGATVYFEVVAYDGSGNQSPPSNLLQYTVPTGSQTQTVTALVNPANAGSVTGNGTFAAGSAVTVTAAANSGYTFSSWTENGTVQSTSPNYSFTLTTNVNLVANFAANPVYFTVATQSGPANAGSVTGGGSFVSGASVTVTATANSGYTFTNWTENGIIQSSSPIYNFTLTANRNLVANFTANPVNYTVATQSSPANAGSATGGGSFVSGTSVTVTATANSGYTFTNWTENGIVQSSSPSYNFTLATNRNLIANFTANPVTNSVTYTVTSSAGINGSINPNGPQSVASGGSITFTTVAAINYQVNQWTVNGTVVQTGGSAYTLQNVTTNTIVAVTFNSSTVNTNNAVAATTIVTNTGNTLTLLVSGNGGVTPNDCGASLTLGKKYTLTASAASGWVFSNWLNNGTVVSTSQKYTFVMESGLVLQANFVTNPFASVGGTYSGLFYVTNNAASQSSGSSVVTLTTNGAYSAKLTLGSQSYSYSGAFSLAGTVFKSISRPGSTPLTVQLQLSWSNGPMTGTINDGTWTADLAANLAVYSKAKLSPQTGKYTLLIPGSSESFLLPGGNGFGSVSVSALGRVSFSGILGDGTRFTSGAIVSCQGEWPLYISLYGGRGSIVGWLSFANGGSIGGQIGWFKPAQTGARFYSAGFTTSAETVGSVYNYTNGLSILGFTAGKLSLNNGNLAQSITNQIALTPDNYKTDLSVNNQSGSHLTFRTLSGLFVGSVENPETGKPMAVNGIVLQNQNVGAGLFLGSTESGSVLLSPAD